MRSALLLLSLSLLFACSGGRRPRSDAGTPLTLDSITVSPPSVMLARDATQSFTATGNYSDGSTRDISAEVTWRSTDIAIATVADGIATALATGSTKIEATLLEKTGSATLVVTPGAIAALAVSPRDASIMSGATVQLAALATFEDGSSMDVTGAVDWVSSDGAVATVAGGLVTGVSSGSAQITAVDAPSNTTSDITTITVTGRTPVAIVVGPSMVQLPIGATQAFTATAQYEDGSSLDITATVDWSSSRPDVGSIDASGLALGVADGITSITASDPDSRVTASVTLRVVAAAIITLTVTPTAATIGMGDRIDFRAHADYTDGTNIDLTSAVMWESSDPLVASVSNTPGQQGRITTVGSGTTVISATEPSSGHSSDDDGTSATLTVTGAALESIVVLPPDITLPLGLTQQYQAIGLYSDNSSSDLSAQVTWDSSNTAAATIDANGLATSLATGITTISAFDPISGLNSDDANQSAELVIAPPALIEIAVTPSARAMVVGGTQQFTATGLFSDGGMQNISNTVAWESTSGAVTIAAGGLATAAISGTAVISALDLPSGISSNDSNQSANINVSIATLLSIAVTPAAASVPVGADVPFVAMGSYDNGATQDLTTVVTWSSSSQATARISNAAGSRGVASALAAGSTTITAMEPGSGISGTTTLGVAVVALTSLVVQPQTATVDIGDTFAFAAIGTFAGGAVHPITNGVTWSTSNANLAGISNAVGSRGVATGVAVGNVTVTAMHAASGQSGTAALAVELGIITVSRSYPGPTVSIDGTLTDYAVDVGSVVFTAADFPVGSVITDVDVSVNFLKTDGSCAAPATGLAYHPETNFRMQGASGTQVILAPPSTWAGDAVISPVTVIFDQSASTAPSGTPVSGTFLPNQPLTGFDGQNPVGTWILQAGDSAGGDPLCVLMYTVTITAQ